MNYQEFIDLYGNQQWYQEIKQDYPTTTLYLELKFKNFILRYDADRFVDLFQCFILDNLHNLNAIESLNKVSKQAFDIDSFNSVSTINSTSNNENVGGYSGFNVEGEFDKRTNESVVKSTNKSINVFGTIKRVLNSPIAPTFFSVVDSFKKFFVMYIPVDF